jgi:hypothetical protein
LIPQLAHDATSPIAALQNALTEFTNNGRLNAAKVVVSALFISTLQLFSKSRGLFINNRL